MPILGPFPIKPLNEIDYVDLVVTDEEENMNDDGLVGRLIPHPEEDEAHKEVSHFLFLMNANNFGDLSGDKNRHNETRNFVIPKIARDWKQIIR